MNVFSWLGLGTKTALLGSRKQSYFELKKKTLLYSGWGNIEVCVRMTTFVKVRGPWSSWLQ